MKKSERIIRYVIYILVLADVGFTVADIYMYSRSFLQHFHCWKCVYKSYLIVAASVSALRIPLFIVGIPLIVLRLHKRIRIYLPVLFLATWLQMMMTVLVSQEYPVIRDVLRIWTNHQSLDFFQKTEKCCGVVGPVDYVFAEKVIPLSCYREYKRKKANLYRVGCSTQSIKPPFVPVVQVVSVLIQYGLVLCILLYLILLKRRIRRRTQWSVYASEGEVTPSDSASEGEVTPSDSGD
ncbi:uncharacterized protein LOC108086991 [Drosophila ficusphila]|uniref:uncharacterized protein LOC108086991 n=1 Tax=Drosophila ficusphila TaxID=30025 RepID=UPI0007E7D650|nr:uncharacterized protein LOC108086991 [Drosophila ficusphila]